MGVRHPRKKEKIDSVKREREGQRGTECKPEKETIDCKVWRGYIHFLQLESHVAEVDA